MKKSIITILVLMPFFMTAQLPDFKTAKQIDLAKMGFDTINLYDNRQLEMLNAGEVGDYEIEFYTVQDNVLYHVFNQTMREIKKVGYFERYTNEERKELSSKIATLGVGKWYAVVGKVKCGYVFEFDVEAKSVTRSVYELVCK